MDNSSFRCANSDGELSPLYRSPDGVYHVVGEITIAPEITMTSILGNLGKLILACGMRRVFVLTPLPRYITEACCSSSAHCLHLSDPGAGIKLCCEIYRLARQITGQLREYPNVTVLNTGDLLVGTTNSIPSDVMAAMSAWGAVHGPQAAYTHIALRIMSLFESTSGQGFKRPREGELAQPSSDPQRSRGLSLSGHPTPQPPASSGDGFRLMDPGRRSLGRAGRSFSEF